jgi:drug/metabolite transporter (DMT)-like permease
MGRKAHAFRSISGQIANTHLAARWRLVMAHELAAGRVESEASARAGWTHVGLAIAALLWAGNFIAGRALRGDIGPLELNVWRWTIALAVLLPFYARTMWRQRSLLREHAGLVLALGITGVVVPHVCIYAALRSTQVVNALLLLTLTPILIIIGARVIYGRLMKPVQVFGMVISLCGAVALIARGNLAVITTLQYGSGDLWMLPAVLAAAAQALLLKRSPPHIAQGPLLAASIMAALALMVPAGLLFGNMVLPRGGRVVGSLAYIGIFASAAAFMLWNRGVARVGPARAAPYLFLMPLYGSALSYLILAEPLEAYQGLAGVAVMIGVWLAR